MNMNAESGQMSEEADMEILLDRNLTGDDDENHKQELQYH
jgi:hypothetical protein